MWPEAIVSWILAAAFVGFVAGKSGRDQLTWTAFSVFCSPMVGLLALLVVGDADSETDRSPEGGQRQCLNRDGQRFPSDRAKCPLCGQPIDAGDSTHPRVA
jgi:hypothetical protein